jgi:murein DD-endopeptidase MepM/ murein hydrolase activator NlpD
MPSSKLRSFVRISLGVLAVLAAAYLLFTGPRQIDRYPTAATSPYRLPWPAGTTRFCGQSNRGIVSHRGDGEFAYDFNMPVGSDVCAARAGIVKRVVVSHDGNGLRKPDNLIAIDHGDGTVAWYMHLQRGGSLVRVGQHVKQGQRIARSGHVGRSLMPHLHFDVTDLERTKTLPVSFADVTSQRGVPRMLFFYTSGNKMVESEPSP